MFNPQAILNADNTAIKSIRYKDGDHTVEISIEDLRQLTDMAENLQDHLDLRALEKREVEIANSKIVAFPGVPHPLERKDTFPQRPSPIPEPLKASNYNDLLDDFLKNIADLKPNDLTIVVRNQMQQGSQFRLFTFYSSGGSDERALMALEHGKQCILHKSFVAPK